MNPTKARSIGRWLGLACVTLALAACGGGGGGSDGATEAGSPDLAATPPPAARDARSGDYTLMAVNGREYTLALDFDARSYRVTGNGVDQGGTLAAAGSEFLLQPGDSVEAGGTTTTRLTVADGAVLGAVALPEGALPFVAPRVFETTLDGAVGLTRFFITRAAGIGAVVAARGSTTTPGFIAIGKAQ